MNFKTYAHQSGLQILRDDFVFIRKMLAKIPQNHHRTVLQRYIAEWLKLMGECECATAGQNLGRRHANRYLLGVVENGTWNS